MNDRREPETETAGFDARLSVEEVSQGVRLHGAAPETKNEIGVEPVLLLIATIAG